MKHFNTYTKKDILLLKNLLISLVKYMRNNDLIIDPLPKVIFINRDYKNAHNFFGKTASYDPKKNIVKIYTLGRHPKDILRSFSHEMIHHEQNLTGKTNGNIKNTNINNDDWLAEREKEAYIKGNMIFRSWSDQLKDKIKFNFYG
jgi:hypothetical protein